MSNSVKKVRIERSSCNGLIWLTIRVFDCNNKSFKNSCGYNVGSDTTEEELILFLLDCLQMTVPNKYLRCRVFDGFQKLRETDSFGNTQDFMVISVDQEKKFKPFKMCKINKCCIV